MNHEQEIVNQLLSLLDTIEDGVGHLIKQLEDSNVDNALAMAEDIFFALSSIKEAVIPLEGHLAFMDEAYFVEVENTLFETLNHLIVLLKTDVNEDHLAKANVIENHFNSWKNSFISNLGPLNFH